VLQVRDDGTGIPESVPTNLSPETSSGDEPNEHDLDDGIGLRLMIYRADLIDATLTIDSADEEGTVVRCLMPLE
jgi:signal transduction histidine kinase